MRVDRLRAEPRAAEIHTQNLTPVIFEIVQDVFVR
jgi:hypothetical protein